MSPEIVQARSVLEQLNRPLTALVPRLGIVLAAGHGKRIRSETSKMLHQIWGKPSVARVAGALEAGLDSPDQVIVVGIKAGEVARQLGAKPGRLFAYQENPVLGLPAGTGDAVRVALEAFAPAPAARDVYIFLGDMGLLTREGVAQFRREFEANPCDMMVLTGLYRGPAEQNYYGRILRVPPADQEGRPSGPDQGKVIEIKEHKDLLGLPACLPYQASYQGRTYRFTREELLEIREINTGVVAFREEPLRAQIGQLKTDNVQGELMLTDMVQILNQRGLVVRAVQAASEEEILAFNVKSVWRQMEAIARHWAYQRLMDLITIVDEEDFFIADEVISQILALDQERGPLDIVVGKGAQVSAGVRLNRKVHLGDNCLLSGNIELGEGVRLGPGVQLSTYARQTMVLEDEVEVLGGDILKGNLRVGRNSRIESGVIMTGSDAHPLRVGRGVTIKGTTYLYGCIVDDELLVEQSVIKCKRLVQVRRRDGSLQPIRYVRPQPEGLDSLSELSSRA
ncbi:MAG: NTP transferase domain-containing protein [Candidatus Latescibacteria bacterium]|nr:NTP transferase domain-containing protein [Candidatus Latescibacterota bacterium]